MPSDIDMVFCCPATEVQPEIAVDDSPVVEEIIGKLSDVPPGTKKNFLVRERNILVINDEGKLYAINGLCSHYNISLENGVYSKGKIRCPIHGACFNVKTGDIEDYPGFDNIHSFEISDANGNLTIRTTEKALSSDRRKAKSTKLKSSSLDDPIIIVGGGPAASIFIDQIRQQKCTTMIILITSELYPPYDRVLVTKRPASTPDAIRLRTDDFYTDNNVQIMKNLTATSLDVKQRRLTLSSGKDLKYSKLVLATGVSPRKLSVPGANLKNIHYLRTIDEGNKVAEGSIGKNVVCIGGSWIGMEIAAAVVSTASSVTVICMTTEPVPALGSDVGAAIRERFEAKGVKFICNVRVESIEGEDHVEKVRLNNGQTVNADIVIAGIGAVPTNDWLKDSGIKLDSRGFIVVDNQFRTNIDMVYGIGDTVSAPLEYWNKDSVNIQHFQTAQTHGQLLAYNIMGKPHPHPNIPFFWCIFFFEFGARFTGYSEGAEEIITRGDVKELNFAKYYIKDDNVVAVCSTGPRAKAAIQFIDIFKRKITVSREEVNKNLDDDWISLLK